MKNKRQDEIINIISNNDVETQNQLLEFLLEAGYKTTQATLSRDIKDLKLVKSFVNNKYVYVLPQLNDDKSSFDKLMKIFKECVISCETAQNILVIKTLPGLASAACSAFDSMKVEKLVGTLAGDDTAFLLFKNNEYAESFLNTISSII